MPALSSLTPQPAHADDLVTATGPDIGTCDQIFLEVSTTVQGPAGPAQSVVTKQALLTRLTQNSATFQLPNFGAPARVTATVKARVVLNAVVTYTNALSLDIDPPVNVGPPAEQPPPSYGYGIPGGGLEAPLAVQRWKFFDPLDPDPTTNTYHLPINPNKMTSPFPTRKITSSFTTAVDGQALITEGAPSLTQWTFGGEIFNAQHYDLLRSWVYDRRRRITVTDHFGRDIVCVFEKFDPTPALTRIRQGKYWRHTYTITATVVSIGRPTVIPG